MQCGLETVEVVGAEHHAVLSGDVDEVEIDPGVGDGASEIGEVLGVTSEAARRLVNRALASLRDDAENLLAA